ncbi:uncharacterized protein BYT42DRAFT_521510 [Radiomyces spectabilis]|uniref:uncharacterized protein n=1 Tax=Radiomyces spectabilis TaxID=64574 RepID=UPI00222104A1|nr:uncharacterized protein BYT42DRAFT_521510 [Radiomyces spectabilis]KAI8369516.1 hypothetical protein BYT42DRAFT_521510 [Radiomyces spectabilis]
MGNTHWNQVVQRARRRNAPSKKKSPFPLASTERRTIYVNMEIPPDELDDYGQPSRTFISNKIRTAKYTWYTFLPRNLFEQFRGIANLYFLFLVILQMFPLFSTSASPVLVVLPLAAILIITGVKDAFEDNKRHKTDQSVNKATTYTLRDWKNVNIPVHKVPVWRRWLNSFKSLIKASFTFTDPVPDDRTFPHLSTNTHRPLTSAQSSPDGRPFPSSPSTIASSFKNTLRSTSSLARVFKKRKIPYRPGKVPHSVLRQSNPSSTPPLQRQSTLLQTVDEKWQSTRWQDINVGDFVYLRNNDAVPADMVVLASSEPDGLCYVETQNLDGETNLKIKRSLQATNDISKPEDCERCKFYIESEPPHANLYSYNGVLKWKVEPRDFMEQEDELKNGSSNTLATDAADAEEDDNVVSHEKTEAITGSSVLLRGCMVRNTGWIIGLVLFTGNETKIMLNSGKTPSKRSKMEKATNPHVIANFVLLFVLCLICSIAASIVYNGHSSANYFEQPDAESATMEGFLMFWTTLVIYQNIIPISLYISVQIVKTASAYFIHTDLDMYNEKLDQACIPKTWNISDDLGQIEYIFSDKTGTLTQNIMEFRRCTINGVTYGLGETEASIGAKLRDNPSAEAADFFKTMDLEKAREEMLQKQMDLFEHKYVNPNSSFVDPKLFEDLAKNDTQSQSLVHFFSALALCHTVIPEIPDPSKPNEIIYKAQSPDESALVATARDVGFTFVAREQDNVIIDAMGERRDMTLLHVLEFNSTRKRMSVIMRSPQDGRIVLLCKGADSVIYERLSELHSDDEASRRQKQVREDTLKDLAVFANEGLRTLCIASRILEEDEYQQWAARYKTASNSISNRDEQIEAVCEEIEQSLTLIGGTAIEDKLQEGVPDTIAVLAKAGIKIWVLTGDKIETAINIGFACNLLTKDMLLISINARDEMDTLEQLRRSQREVNEKASFQKCALVIDGESLKYGLENPCKEELLTLGTQCMAVICCRVSPMQKAKVVNMVKKGLKVMTLAIGDGANDVSMIQEANVGVGISGEEGRQAVMASDYAIAQFRYLSKLLLVHGRWSYLRTSEMILTFFYKNIMWTLVLFWYQIFCGFSGTMMFDYSYITLYNLVFTSLPCIFAGVLDQDLKAQYSFKYPQLYLMGIRNDKFKSSRFYLTVLDAIYQSAVCFGIPYLVFIGGKMSSHGYDNEGVYELGTFIAGIAVVVANALVGFTIFSWTWIMVAVIVLSSATFFIWTGVYAQIVTFTFYGEDILFRDGSFWLCLVLTFVICMLPRFVTKYYLHMYMPFDNDIVREMVLCNNDSTLSRLKRGTKAPLEEEMPITMTRTHSEQSALAERVDELFVAENAYPLTEPPATFSHYRLNRTLTNVSGTSEIMYMKSGQRTSFTGFAYSSDDASAFDAFRKSVYRQPKKMSPSKLYYHVRNSTTSLETTCKGKVLGEDWMPLDGFRLKRYETAPTADSYQRQPNNLGWKMMRAMKQRLSTRSSQHRSSDAYSTLGASDTTLLAPQPVGKLSYDSSDHRSLASSASDLPPSTSQTFSDNDTEMVEINRPSSP